MNSIPTRKSSVLNNDRTIQFLSSVPLLADLSLETMDHIGEAATVVHVKRNRPVWQSGQTADAVYFLRTGVIREHVSGPDDRETTIGIYARRTMIGLTGAIADNTWFTTAVAHEDSTLYKVPTKAVIKLVENDRLFSTVLTAQLFEQLKRAQLFTPNMLNNSAQSRLAEVLLELANDFSINDSRGTIINIKLTHRIIATMTGTTRETVSFAILDLRKKGLIKNDGKRFIIVDMKALRAIATS